MYRVFVRDDMVAHLYATRRTRMTLALTGVVRTRMQHDVRYLPYMISFASLHQFGICFAFVVAILYILHGFLCFAALVLLSNCAGLAAMSTHSGPDVLYGLQWQAVVHPRVRALRH